MVLVTKDKVSSEAIIAKNVARLLNDMGYRGLEVEVYAIHDIVQDHDLGSRLDRACTWVGGSLERVKEVLRGTETDRRLEFFDF